MAHAKDKPALITDAPVSQADQLRTRQIRYGIMMGIRALLLIIATVLAMVGAPMPWLWLSLCAIGMVLLPWMAVMVANDRLPKDEHRISRKASFRRAKPDSTPAVSSKKSRVIDVDS